MTQRKSISWILQFTSERPNKAEKIKCLQANDNLQIKEVLKYAFDPKIKWILPPGTPPYEPCKYKSQEGVLYANTRKLYLFVEGGSPNLNQIKREKLFIDLLEELDPEDAKLLIAIKDGNFPYPGLTAKIVKEAFPGLF